MADGYISQITLPDNSTYDFRDKNLKLYTGTCSTAAGTAIKDVTTDGTFTLVKGTILFVNFTTTNSAAVSNLKLKINGENDTNAKPIKYLVNGNDPANIPGAGYLRANQTYMFRYDGTNWVADLNYYTYTNDFASRVGHYNNILARKAITAESLIVGDSTGYEKVASGVTFDLAYPIVWCTAAVAANASNYANMFLQHYDRNIATGAKAGFSSSANKVIYLIVTISSNIATIDADIITDTLPSEEDGKVYISLGKLGAQSTGANYFFLYPEHPMFWYKNGEIEPYMGAVVYQSGITTDNDYPILFKHSNNTSDEYNGINYSNSSTNPATLNPSTGQLKVASLKISIKNDNYGLLPHTTNYNQIGSSSLYWYRAYITNYYGTTSNITNWAAGKNIGTPASSSAAATLGSVNFYNACTKGGTQTKTLLTADSTTNTNITLTMPNTTGTLALISDIPTTMAWSSITNTPTTLSGYGITDAKIASGVITLGSNTITPVTSVNGHTGSSVSITAGDLNLSSALRFIGKASTNMSESTTTAPTVTGVTNYVPIVGDVVLDKNDEFEYVCIAVSGTTYTWEKLGASSSYKTVQTAVSSATAETDTATTFVYSVTQNTNGVITVKTRPLPTYNNYSHPTGDGNLHVPATGTSNNGKFLKAGSTAGSLSWGTAVTSITIKTSSPLTGGSDTATTTTGTYTIGFSAQAKNTVLAGPISTATANAVPTFRALEAADIPSLTKAKISDFSHNHGNIANGGTIGQTANWALASGDGLIIFDSSNSNKIERSGITFDGSTETKGLTPKGTWVDYAGGTKVTLNGTAKGASTASFYAPSEAGINGQFLKSTGGAPEWKTLDSKDIHPLESKTYESTSFYGGGDNYDSTTWFFMKIRPDTWYKPWKIRVKIRSYCPTHTECDSITYALVTGRLNGYSYANWNERNDSYAHYYTSIRLANKTGYDANQSHAFGISIRYASNYTNSGWYRTFEVDLLETENCTITLLDTPVLWANWPEGTSNYGGWNVPDAVTRGLCETNDTTANNDDRTLQDIMYFRFKSGAAGIGRYTLLMEESTGVYSSLTTTFPTSNTPLTTLTMNTGVKYKLGRIIYFNQGANRAANTNIGNDNQYFTAYSLIDGRYTFQYAAGALTAYKPFYMVGTLDTDGFFTIDPAATAWAQDLPTANTTKVYVYLGTVYPDTNPYRIALELHHPIYTFKDDALKEIHPGIISGNADTATTATNLANNPSIQTSGTTQITITAGGKTSSAYTVPYATSAGSAAAITTAGTTAQFYRGDNSWSNTLGNTTLSNTAFTDTLVIYAHQSNESAATSFDATKSSWGIGFQRKWSNSTTGAVHAGIYAFGQSNWRAGLAFRVKTGTSANNTHDTTALVLNHDGSAIFIDNITAHHLYNSTNATYDIGATATRWRTAYLSTSLLVGAASTITAYDSNALGSFVGPGVFSSCVTTAGSGYFLMGQGTEYGRIYVETIGVASTPTTYTNPSDSSQTKTGYINGKLGKTYLVLGNSKVAGSNGSSYSSPGSATTANNAQGFLRLYSNVAGSADLTAYTGGDKTRIQPVEGYAVPVNKIGIMFRPDSGSYYTHFSYETTGNEALVMATQNAVTSFIFVNGESYANVASDRWTKLDGSGASGKGNAPGLQIKKNCVSIGKLIPSGTDPSYKLQVYGQTYLNGSASSTTNLSGQLIVANEASTNVALELWRNANASWQIANEQGILYFRNNFTTAKQSTYTQTAISIAYNTGNTTFAGSVTATGGFSGTLSGNATSATKANITSNKYGVAYYSDTDGTFATTGQGTSGYVLQAGGSSAAPSWINATNTNTGSTIVKRDSNGDFSARTITASLTGNASSATKVAAKLDTSHKTYLLGTQTAITGTAANVDLTGDTGVYLWTDAGSLSATHFQVNDGTNERVILQWNATDSSLDFIFA